MTDFPDLKLKAQVTFPARVDGGAGIDVTKTNGNYTFDLAYDDFAPSVATIPNQTQQNLLLWNSLSDQYTLVAASQLATITGPNLFNTSAASIPINVYALSGETTRFGAFVLRGADTGAHSGIEHSGMAIESRPVGSGTNGPTSADYGQTISVIKTGWPSAIVNGEIDGINIVLRQTVGDAAGILYNIGVVSGFAAANESITNQFNTSATILKGVRTQTGVIDTVNASQFGALLNAEVSACYSAVQAQDDSAGGSWTNYFTGVKNGVVNYQVTGIGTTVLYAQTGATPKKTLRSNLGSFSILNDAGSGEILNITDAGLATLAQPLPTASGGTGYGGIGWTAFTCTAVPGAGTITAQVSDAAYLQIGKIVLVNAKVTITTVGSATGSVTLNIPVAAKRQGFLPGRESGSGGKMISVVTAAASTVAPAFNYDNTNVTLASGAVYVFSGCYEAN